MSKHTPGPWVISEDETGVESPGQMPTTAYHNDGQPDVCHLEDGEYISYKSKEEMLANAQLIAAAPELLLALKDFVNWVDGRQAMGWKLGSHLDPVYVTAVELLKRVEGR